MYRCSSEPRQVGYTLFLRPLAIGVRKKGIRVAGDLVLCKLPANSPLVPQIGLGWRNVI